MSLTGQATSPSNVQLIIGALADYSKETGIDLSNNPIATALEQSNSPETILQLLRQREKAFKEYRDVNRRLINCLSPAVKVLQAFSGILSEAVPFSPAKALLVGIDALLDAACRVSSSYDALLNLFECLGNFLRRLEIYTMLPLTSVMTDIIVKIMVEILSVLALATKQIKEGRFKKFAKKLLGDSEIEATVERLDRLTQDEARMTATQTMSVVHGLVGSVKVIMEDREASMDGIRQDLVTLHQELHEINKTKRDQLQRDVRHWLAPPDPSTNQNFVSEARHSGTAAWFFVSDALAEWKARGSLLWIYGKPGAGKSTLLSAIIQEIEGKHAAGLATMAYYYFDFRDVKKQGCYGFLSSLISQLSAESDSCYNILSQLYSANNRGARKPSISALKNCMTDMLSQPGQGPVYIIADALDECPNFSGIPSAREKVLKLIEELVELKLPNVHLCVASRPEIDIRMMLEPLTSLKVSLHDEIGQKEDIVRYIKFIISSDKDMHKWTEENKQLVVDVLSDKADGMFRWIVCQIDRLRRTLPASIRRVLNDLPKTLDETYGRTLQCIDEEKREYAQRLFQCLIVSIRPLRVKELAEILAIQFDDEALPTFNAAWRPGNAEQAVMSVCSSLIAVVDSRGHQVVQFAHFSVKEFLTSDRLAAAEESLSYYHILPEPAHTMLAHASLSVLLHLDDKIDRSTIRHFPLAPYAARHWVDHAQYKNVSAHIQEVMERLFDPGKPCFAAWIWLYNIDRHWIEPMSTTHPTRPEAVPLYYASLCGFGGLVEHLIVSHSIDVNSRGGSHTTPLHAASVKGHLEVASLLLRNGADSNSRDDLGRAPLHRVSQGGQLVNVESLPEIARILLKSDATVNVIDNRRRTPLHAAARSGYRDIAQLLLESGAILDARNENQETPLHLACGNGKLDVSRLLIDRGSDIKSREKSGLTPLLMASRFGHMGVSQLLLDRGSNVHELETQHFSCLHYASRYGYLDLARFLIDRDADVNTHKADGLSPLYLASYYGHLDTTKLLVKRGAHIDGRNEKQGTPLSGASKKGYLDIARFLIESGATVSTRDDKGSTPIHKASFYGHLRVVKLLIERGIDVDIRNGDEETSLYQASRNGKLDIVRFLIEQGADIQISDKIGSDPVHIASQNGHLDIVRLLINSGTPVDTRNGVQRTSLVLASRYGRVEVGRFLIKRGADLNARNNQSWGPLHFASRYGHFDMVQLLLDHGVDANTQKDDLCTPLHLASANGQLEVTKLLLQRGAAVDVVNDKHETPLYQAVWYEKVAIAHLLIDHGANLHTADNNGCTLLHVASQRGHLGVVKPLLCCWGVDVDALNVANKTAAELASENGKTEVAKFLSDYKADKIIPNDKHSTTMDTTQYDAHDDGKDGPEVSLHAAVEEGNIDVVSSLLEQGVDINARGANNETPLHRAAAKGNVNVVRLLIERGAELDLRNEWEDTPLHLSSVNGHLEVSRVLVDHGANLNARQRNYRTPTHFSTHNGHLEVVKLLLECGADIHAIDGEGETPYQVSLRRGQREIADLLRKHGAG